MLMMALKVGHPVALLMLMVLEGFGLWDEAGPADAVGQEDGPASASGCGTRGFGLLMLMMMEGSGCGRPVWSY